MLEGVRDIAGMIAYIIFLKNIGRAQVPIVFGEETDG